MNSEAWQEQQELEEQAEQSEYELYCSIVEALVEAKKLGVSSDNLHTLCYATGVNLTELI
jgi:hypothetical protein